MIQTLLARRVPQLTGLYLVVSWGFVQFVDWAVDQYTLSPALTNLVVTLLLLLLPTVLVLAWRHGAPGDDRWTKTDAAAIGLNFTAASGILFMMFGGQELGAATTVKLIEDAEGNTVERVVPRAAFRRNVLLFDFDNETGEPDLDWIGSGIVQGVTFDLAQDVFVTFVILNDPSVKERLAEAGFQPTDKIPLSLKHGAAAGRSLGHFMDGTVESEGDALVVETRLYETSSARLLQRRSYRGTDPLEMADRISVDLRRDLGIPDWQIAGSVDLPAAELLTTSPDAFRALIESLRLLASNDHVTARTMAEQAIEHDSTFAFAYLVAAHLALMAGDQAANQTRFAEGLSYVYRLPERLRLSVQVIDQFRYKQDYQAAIRAARYWSEIYPEDVEARRLQAMLHESTGNPDGQIEQYRAILAIDSLDVESMRSLAGAFRATEEYDSALVYYERLGDRLPTDVQTRLDVASTLRSLGKYSETREKLEQTLVAAPQDPRVFRQLARLDLREGRYEDAIARTEQVAALARTPQQRERTAGLQETLYYERGQFARLEDAYRRRLATLAEFQPPLMVVSNIVGSEYLILAAEAGREESALRQLDSLRNAVEAPWNLMIEYPAVEIYLDLGNRQSARTSLDGIRSFVETIGQSRDLTANIAWLEGRVAGLEDGECRRALDSYDEASRLAPLDARYRLSRLGCLTELERWSDAESEVAWLLARYPGSAKYRLAIAHYHAARGQTAEAIGHLEAALGFWSEADAEYIPAQEARVLLAELQGT